VRGRNFRNVIYYLSNTKIVRASERIRFGATAAMATSVASVWSVRIADYTLVSADRCLDLGHPEGKHDQSAAFGKRCACGAR
jgi:hypothetical protein